MNVETLGSPVISGERVERIYQCTHGDGITLFRSYVDERHYADGYFRDEMSSVTEGVYDTVRLVFTSTLDGTTGQDTRTVYSMDSTPTARDIRYHADYLTNWKYNLYQFTKTGETFAPAVPGWWNTAKDLEITGTDAEKYQWGESLPNSTGGQWYLLMGRTMATDTYPYPAPTVQETVYCSNYNKASSMVLQSGTCKKPGKTFTLPNAKEYWQVTNSSMHKEGRKWVVTSSYQYAPRKWDGRIIPGGAPGGGEL